MRILEVGKEYEVTKRIKLHTKPIVTARITNQGKFIKETEKYFFFVGFKVRKACVISIIERR